MDTTKKMDDANQYIVISMGDEQFGIDIKYIDNIVKMQHITRVPNVASYIRGIINLRGEIIPVMSLRRKMGMDDDVETKASRIIILRLEQLGMLGIIVDEVKEVLTLDDEDVEKKAVTENKEDTDSYIFGVGKYGESLVSLLDVNSVVAFE
ncbi:MAG: chemotaxis protein CheW [Lachnospiraceae bacterium]|nr:chemotaxis protein CheW [Lachnospiraceae bacterium]